MNAKRFSSVLVISTLFVVATFYVGLRYYRCHQRQEYNKRRFANALYDPIANDIQKQIIEVYGKRLEVVFPDSTQVLFASAEKGDLLECTFIAILKLKIDAKDREALEASFRQKNRAASISEIDFYLLNDNYAPGNIWDPKSLKECNFYIDKSLMNRMCIGKNDHGDILIYLFYATI